MSIGVELLKSQGDHVAPHLETARHERASAPRLGKLKETRGGAFSPLTPELHCALHGSAF
jgi:hypothetical protein